MQGLLHRTSVDSSLSKASHQCSGARGHRGTIGVSSKTPCDSETYPWNPGDPRHDPAVFALDPARETRRGVPGGSVKVSIHRSPLAILKLVYVCRVRGSDFDQKQERERSTWIRIRLSAHAPLRKILRFIVHPLQA